MNARFAFKKNKSISERSSWIVSIYNNAADIMEHDKRTMFRLTSEAYGKNSKAKNKQVIIREVSDVIFLNYSNLTVDEHQR
tara:strand:+ start:922 stop:1164 length:243 start_codon:yes stop_codon:yes gene_type:complete